MNADFLNIVLALDVGIFLGIALAIMWERL